MREAHRDEVREGGGPNPNPITLTLLPSPLTFHPNPNPNPNPNPTLFTRCSRVEAARPPEACSSRREMKADTHVWTAHNGPSNERRRHVARGPRHVARAAACFFRHGGGGVVEVGGGGGGVGGGGDSMEF